MQDAVHPMAAHWALEPGIDFLNHGSFGACPTAVLQAQRRLQEEMERQPVRFLARELEGRLDVARAAIASFVGADAAGLVAVSNATMGVNTVLRSVALKAGDELLTTDHAYGACANALRFAAAKAGARVVIARVPFPLKRSSEVLDAIMACVTPRTRLALIDHITSPTGLVLPVARIVDALHQRGVDTLVDGAHAPGMVALDLGAINAAYYTGNLHKWVCAPKGAGFLHVREDRREAIHPLVISHGAEIPLRDRSRFVAEFDWVGTMDPTPFLTAPVAVDFIASLAPGGWPEWMARNRALALLALDALCSALGVDPPAPNEMIAALAAVPVSDGSSEALQEHLLRDHGFEVPVVPWPCPPSRMLRISAQGYNHEGQYRRLAMRLARPDHSD